MHAKPDLRALSLLARFPFRLGDHCRYPAQAPHLQFTLPNLFHLTAAFSFVLAVELFVGLFARIGYLLPYEAAFIVGPLSALTTVVFFFLPARSPRDAANPEHTDQINWWIAIYFAIIATALAISLLLRHESGGPHSGMANAVNLVHASTFVSIVAGGKMLILWHRRATLGPSGLVLGIMLLFLLPSALTIALV